MKNTVADIEKLMKDGYKEEEIRKIFEENLKGAKEKIKEQEEKESSKEITKAKLTKALIEYMLARDIIMEDETEKVQEIIEDLLSSYEKTEGFCKEVCPVDESRSEFLRSFFGFPL